MLDRLNERTFAIASSLVLKCSQTSRFISQAPCDRPSHFQTPTRITSRLKIWNPRIWLYYLVRTTRLCSEVGISNVTRSGHRILSDQEDYRLWYCGESVKMSCNEDIHDIGYRGPAPFSIQISCTVISDLVQQMQQGLAEN